MLQSAVIPVVTLNILAVAIMAGVAFFGSQAKPPKVILEARYAPALETLDARVEDIRDQKRSAKPGAPPVVNRPAPPSRRPPKPSAPPPPDTRPHSSAAPSPSHAPVPVPAPAPSENAYLTKLLAEPDADKSTNMLVSMIAHTRKLAHSRDEGVFWDAHPRTLKTPLGDLDLQLGFRNDSETLLRIQAASAHTPVYGRFLLENVIRSLKRNRKAHTTPPAVLSFSTDTFKALHKSLRLLNKSIVAIIKLASSVIDITFVQVPNGAVPTSRRIYHDDINEILMITPKKHAIAIRAQASGSYIFDLYVRADLEAALKSNSDCISHRQIRWKDNGTQIVWDWDRPMR